MKLDIKLTGHEAIDNCFRGLPNVLQDKVLQDAHAQAVKFTVERAKLLAPEGPTGNLIDSIGVIRAPKKGRDELGLVIAGPRRGRGKGGNHGHLVEYGTKERHLKSNGANRGVMPAKPFMAPAWEQTKEKVMSVIPEQIGRKLKTFMKRTIKNAR